MAKLNDPLAQRRPIPQPTFGAPGVPQVQPSPVGQGITSIGRAIERGSEEIYRAARIEEERINTLRAEEAFSQLRERQLSLTAGDEGFLKIHGSEAVRRPLLNDYGKSFDDAEREITQTLANDTQRQKFKSRSDVARLQFQEGILRHLEKEGETYAKEVFEGIIASEQQNAAARWDSPNDVGLSLTRIENAVDERAERYGWDDEYKNAVLNQERGKVHAAVVGQAVTDGSYRYAQEWFEKHKDQVDASTAKQLSAAVRDAAQKELTNKYNSDYLANENSFKVLDALRTKVLGDNTLNDDRKNILVGRIQNRQHVLERRAEVEEAKRLRVIQRGIDELNFNTLAGFEPNSEQFQSLVDQAQGTEMEAEVRRAISMAEATRTFRTAPPLAQEKMLTDAQAELRKNPTKFNLKTVEAWNTIHDAQRLQVQKDPVSFAVRQGFIGAPTPVDLSDPDASASSLAERFIIARGIASRYQAPFKPLTEQEMTVLTSALSHATVEQKRNYFGALNRAVGGDVPGYMAIMSQLAPDDPVSAVAGSHAAVGREHSADLMLRGQGILTPPSKQDGKPDTGNLLPMPSETDLRMQFDNYVRESFAGKAELRSAHYQAAKSIYAALSVDAGDRDTKLLDSDRWEQAIELAIGPIEKYNGRRVVLPDGVDTSGFRDGVRDRIDQVIINTDLDKSWTKERLRDLPLENIGDGRYLLRSGDGIVVDKTGRPVVLNFNLPTVERERFETDDFLMDVMTRDVR